MIRIFNENDIDICAQILVEAYNCEPWNFHWTERTATRYLTEFALSNDFVGFVIEKDNSVVGAMFAHRKTWWTNDEIFVDELFIKPAFQKQGLGKAMLQHGESYCKSKGLAGLTLLTNRGMPSQAFYENNGFTLAEHVIYFYKEL